MAHPLAGYSDASIVHDRDCGIRRTMRSPQPPIPKPAKSSAPPESHGRPGYETPAIPAGAAVARRARCPRRKLACFCSAPMAGFYSAVDIPS